jgi:hypothetical protein
VSIFQRKTMPNRGPFFACLLMTEARLRKQTVCFGKQSILLSKSTKYKCRKVNGTQGNTINQRFRPLLQTSSVK